MNRKFAGVRYKKKTFNADEISVVQITKSAPRVFRVERVYRVRGIIFNEMPKDFKYIKTRVKPAQCVQIAANNARIYLHAVDAGRSTFVI